MLRSLAIVSSLLRKSIRTLSQAPTSRASKEIFVGRGVSPSLRDSSAAERAPVDRTHSPNSRTRSSPAVRRFTSQPLCIAVVDPVALRLTEALVVATMRLSANSEHQLCLPD